VLRPPAPDLGYTFWDVAACHADDAAAAVFDGLMDARFSSRVTT
jgi:hypothetical protein